MSSVRKIQVRLPPQFEATASGTHLTSPNTLPSDDEPSDTWKRKRAEALLSVDRCLAALHSAEHCSGASTCDGGPAHDEGSRGDVAHGVAKADPAEDLMHLVCVDDNMYYRSMRYEYCKLARGHVVGFAQVIYGLVHCMYAHVM